MGTSSEPENLQRFRKGKSHRDLRRSHPQLRQEPPSGIHRAPAEAQAPTLTSGVVVGFDGAVTLSEVHALIRSS